jgi:hypothetical protein
MKPGYVILVENLIEPKETINQKRPSISPVSALTSTLRYPGAVGRPGIVWMSAARA